MADLQTSIMDIRLEFEQQQRRERIRSMDVFEHWENDLELEERDKVSDLRSEKPKDDRLLEFGLIYQTKS